MEAPPPPPAAEDVVMISPPPAPEPPRCIHGNTGRCPGCMQQRTAQFFDRIETAPATQSIFTSALAAARERAAASAERAAASAEAKSSWLFGNKDPEDADDEADKARMAGIRSLGAGTPTAGVRSLGSGAPSFPGPTPDAWNVVTKPAGAWPPAGAELPGGVRDLLVKLDLEIEQARATATTEELENTIDALSAVQRSLAVEAARRQLVLENKCSVCLDSTKNCVLMDCMHVTTCVGCAKKLSTCPTCRAPVTSVRRIFTS